MNSRGECANGRLWSIHDRSVHREERWLGFKGVAPQAREVANCLTFWTAVSVRNRWAPDTLAVHVHDKADVFIYDRIETTQDHRRKGLGVAVMIALGTARKSIVSPQRGSRASLQSQAE